MNLQEKIGARHVRLALAVLAGSALFAGAAGAEEQIQKVEITGSAIKRINVEGALPVQRLSQEAIAKSGATTVADLIQALPSMQGFTIEAVAAGTNSGGRVSANIHGIGESYTLVLLNGRRIAPQGSGSTINLNAIPMSAVQSVEILTDGASALYGSDAIGGVINFILKKNMQGGNVEAQYRQPGQSGAGRNSYAALTYGFGDLEENRYNVLMSYRHDEQAAMKSTDREFSKTAYLPFMHNGTPYVYDRTSTATIPANVSVAFTADSKLSPVGFSPFLKANGKCPALNYESLVNTATVQNCAFDFVTMVEVVPESKRDSFFGKATFKATPDINVFTEMAFSRLDLTARIAANTAPFTITKGTDMYTKYVAPNLTTAQQAAIRTISGNYRTYDWGPRASQTLTDSANFVVGAEGTVGAWDFGTGLTWSRNKIDERYVGGYAKNTEFRDMLAKNQFDPFAPIGAQSDATKALIANSIFHGSIREASTTLKSIDAHGSRELFSLPGGKAQIAVGGDYRNYHYVQTPNADSTMIYNFNASPAYDLERNNYGVFTEVNAPVIKGLEISGAARYDTFEAVKNAIANRTMGAKESSSTYKVSARWQPSQTMLFRASYGTGFKAPSMLDIGQPLVNAGFTASSWDCPANLAKENPNFCRIGKTQYNVISGGNENLKPEKSKQYTLGFRIEPTASFSIQADLWDVKLRDAVSSVNEAQIFADPVKFRELFTTYTEPSTGNTYWAKKTLSINIGQTHNQGIDWETTYRHRFGFGKLDSTLAGTYLLKADYTVPGTSNVWTNDMNFFGIDDAVSFRHIVRWTNTLETGAFSNSLVANYRNGYTDAEQSVRNMNTKVNETLRLHVPSYLTFDWQGKWAITKAASLRAGIKNIADRNPPLTLRASSGHQVGYDPRYADTMGRTFYLTGSYNF
ncbi:TonB-dependent receptor [Duganella sp. FT92W]|uniref:TonB-dependent receptor n=1 Tax=Pseudoduganella rivuli TaxID=2666085 RepID=A0A7X2IV23_9BURK|nr:TonB-dependent receptor [Pseudoduganella rivuli]MRV76554.1 TonB-dependent receptor [Pseudoduganella rivuli]